MTWLCSLVSLHIVIIIILNYWSLHVILPMDSPKLEIYFSKQYANQSFATIAQPAIMPMFREPLRDRFRLLTDNRTASNTASDRQSETFIPSYNLNQWTSINQDTSALSSWFHPFINCEHNQAFNILNVSFKNKRILFYFLADDICSVYKSIAWLKSNIFKEQKVWFI